MKKLIVIVFLILSCNIYSQELGILFKNKQETFEILRERFPEQEPRQFLIDGDTTISVVINYNTFFFFKFINDFCYHEEFRTRDMSYNIDSINLILSKDLPKDKHGNYYYDIGEYRFYYQVIIRSNLYKVITTFRKYGTIKETND